ncbi:MAG TPA: tetratricopeptide repeat protein, partial [bacterium]|nr:tetratricopeptide repeat protein [bacterium]
MKKITLILIFCFFYTFSISNANILNTRETRDFNFAVELFDKDINLAIEQFENFIKKYPRSSYLKDAYFWIGIGHLNLENFQDAAIKFQFIVDNFSKSDKYSPALYNLGLTYYKLSNFLLSAEYFQKFINIEKNKTKKSDFFAAALNYLGDCYFNLAKYQDAEKTYFEYLALSKNPEVEYKYFKALIHNKNYQAAYNFYNLTKFDTAINFDDSEYIKFSIYLGDIAAALNNFNEAISYYSKALANENSELINLIFLKLSQIYYSLKKPDESIEFLKKLANSKFENFKSEADYKIALIYYELKNYHSAIFHLKKSIENYPEDRFSEKINILVNLYYTIDDYQKVAETYEKHIKSNEKFNLITTLDLRIKIAYSYFKINQLEQALQLSSNLTISKSPQYYNLKYIELLAYYNLKDYFRVITEIKLLLLDDKLSDSFKYKFKKLLADSYFDIKDYGAAEKHYTELINLEHPEFNHYDILAALGVTYLKQNKFDFAELLIKNILAENTQTSLKFQQFILLFCETINNEIKSEYYLNELLKITNNAIISDKANFMLAQLNFKNKNYNISINNLKKISENYLTNDRYYLFALNYYNLKNYVNSIENLDKISDYSNDTNKIAKLYILNYYELQNYRNIIEKANLLSDAAELENKLFYSGIAHYYLKEFSTAKTLFEKFLENFNISTYYYQTLYYLAVCEFNLKNYDSALSLFLRLDASPEKNKFDYQKYLAYLYLQDNQNSK